VGWKEIVVALKPKPVIVSIVMNEPHLPKTVVIYHRSDFDGIFCREIARKFIPDAELIGWDYNDPEPVVDPHDHLYILDLSVPGLMGHPNLIWIDHHKSAIEKYPSTIPGYRIDGVAACRLAWYWFTAWKNGAGPDIKDLNGVPVNMATHKTFYDRFVIEPLAVRLAGEYDIWDKRDPRAELFQHGLRSRELTPLIWGALLSKDSYNEEMVVEGLLERGEALQFAQKTQNESIINAYGFTVQWEGLTFLACNHARFNSFLFVAGLKPEHDACLGFNYDGVNRCWRFSLYHAPGKEHHDLSLIATKHGGGGHRGACGFRLDSIPFFS
jgi:hypothetical protein